MTVRDLIEQLLRCDMDYEVYVSEPNDLDDYFVDSVSVNDTQRQVHIKTSQ